MKPFVKWANKNEIEYLSASIVDDWVIFVANSYSGQAGLMGAWDIKGKKLVHLTDEPFIYKAMKVEDKLVSLKSVAYWGHPLTYNLDEIEFGIVDISKTSSNVKENISFKPKKGQLTLDYNGKTIVFHVETLKGQRT